MKTIPMWFHEDLATIVGAIHRYSDAIYQEAVANAFPIYPIDDLRTIKQWDEAFWKYLNPKGMNVVYPRIYRNANLMEGLEGISKSIE
jgi:hypothetical protein